MSSICKPQSALPKAHHRYALTAEKERLGIEVPNVISDRPYFIDSHRKEFIARSIGTWAFPAHELSEEELVHAAYLMLKHVLEMPELEKWRISNGSLENDPPRKSARLTNF